MIESLSSIEYRVRLAEKATEVVEIIRVKLSCDSCWRGSFGALRPWGARPRGITSLALPESLEVLRLSNCEACNSK
jgi:Zn finger protein HypA/HybF involved in hydrogenase expression